MLVLMKHLTESVPLPDIREMPDAGIIVIAAIPLAG